MRDKIYLLYNRLSERFSEPFGCASDALAKRRVKHFMQQSQVDLSDFDLFVVGSYDLTTGTVEVCERLRIPFTDDTINSIEKELQNER